MAILPFSLMIRAETVAQAALIIYNTQWELSAADGVEVIDMPLRLFFCCQENPDTA